MTEKFVARGDVANYIATGVITSGQVVVMGHTLGVALKSGVSTDVIAAAIEGVFELPKVPAATYVVGEKLVFDVSAAAGAGEFDDALATPAAGDLTGAAIAMRVGLNAETTGLVKLTPGNALRT